MSKKEKALERIRQNPKHVRFEELETILLRLGFQKRQDGTSHAMFTLGDTLDIIGNKLRAPSRRFGSNDPGA